MIVLFFFWRGLSIVVARCLVYVLKRLDSLFFGPFILSIIKVVVYR
jgi:hypothetical protein